MKRKTLQKFRGKQQKTCGLALSNSKRERKVWKPFWKVSLKRQTLIFKNLIYEFRLIETDKGFFKNFKTILIDRKLVLIDRNRQKLTKNLKKNFDWSKNRLDQSKIWKTAFLKKKKPDFWKHSSKHWI